jgi:hypothetical protein
MTIADFHFGEAAVRPARAGPIPFAIIPGVGDTNDRLDEMEGVLRVLTKDVKLFREQCNGTEPQEVDSTSSGCHRAYVRSVFALIEAILEQHKSLLLDLLDSDNVCLDAKAAEMLRERDRFMRLRAKIKTVHKAAAVAFGQKLRIDCSTAGWRALVAAIAVRDRITHPNSFEECSVQIWDLDRVAEGEAWFRSLHNEIIRVAREHRSANGWRPRSSCPAPPVV